jgi:hypothetical protein
MIFVGRRLAANSHWGALGLHTFLFTRKLQKFGLRWECDAVDGDIQENAAECEWA